MFAPQRVGVQIRPGRKGHDWFGLIVEKLFNDDTTAQMDEHFFTEDGPKPEKFHEILQYCQWINLGSLGWRQSLNTSSEIFAPT